MSGAVAVPVAGARLAATLRRPPGPPVGCVLVGPGLGGVRDARTAALSARFTAAGLAALSFDHRGFGGSEGAPRLVADPRRQLADWRALIAFARALPDVRDDAVCLWAGALAAGQAIALAAEDPAIAAIVCHAAVLDTRRAALRLGPRRAGWLARAAARDALRGAVGLPGLRLVAPGTGPAGGAAGDGVAPVGQPADESVGSAGRTARNGEASVGRPVDGWDARLVGAAAAREPDRGVRARSLVNLFARRSPARVRAIRCPVLFVGLADEPLVPTAPLRRAARRARDGEYRELDCALADLRMPGDWLDRAASLELRFLLDALARPRSRARARESAGDLHASPVAQARRLVAPVAVFGRRLAPTLVLPSRRSPERLARELRLGFARLGPGYVKIGQVVASSPGLFPDAVVDEFGKLLDAVEPADPQAVRALIERELGMPPERAFERFDERPLASASIAQVHAATLPGGERVVVKVQRPGIRERLAADVTLVRRIAWLASHSSIARLANPVAVIDDFVATLREELDFTREARAMAAFEANLRSNGDRHERVHVPAVHWSHTTERVLTMERIDGTRIDDLVTLRDAGHDLPAALHVAMRAWIESVLVHGLFHGDMHAGNLLIDGRGDVAFVDFGIVGRLDDRTRTILADTIRALLKKGDFGAVARAAHQLGAVGAPSAAGEAARDVGRLMAPLINRPLHELSFAELLKRIVEIGPRYDLQLPRELVLVAKQILYFERYMKLLAPDWHILTDTELFGFLIEGAERA